MSQSHYTLPQPSEYSFSDYCVPLFQTSNETKSAQNFLPGFAPQSSSLWNALGTDEPAQTGTPVYVHPIPSTAANHGYPASSSSQNDSWPLPSLTHSGDSSPASESPTQLSTPTSALDSWPVATHGFWQESSFLPTDYRPEDLPPDRIRGDHSHAMWIAHQQSTIRHNLLSDEGIVAKHEKFGLPTSAGQLYTSEIGAESYTPNALQAQNNDSDDATRGTRKGKRKADDSPCAEDSVGDAPSHKRARLADSEEHSVKGDQQACLTSGYQVKMHQDERYMASAPENYPPALARNGSRVADKSSKGYTFYEHVGSVNSKGQASTRKWRLQDQNFLADTVESLTALTAPEVPAALDIGSSSDYRDVVRNAGYEESGGFDRLRWMGGGKRVATRRRAPIKSSVPKYRVT